MEEINIKDFLRYLRKYLALIIIITSLSVIGIIVYEKNFKKPMYTTYTTIILVKNDNDDIKSAETITQSDITLNQKLVATYRQIVKSKLVLEQVIRELNLDYTYSKLSKEIKVEALDDTSILKISVTDADSGRAVIIANKLANVFTKEVTEIFNINNVSKLDIAQESLKPSNDTLTRDIILAALISLIGTIGIIFIIYYFDDTLKLTEDIESEIEMPVIAKVFKDHSKEDLIVDKKPKAITSESIRTLRTNLQFSSIDNELKTILVTSTTPSEGKSFISANLAISFAQSGKRVLLIDCDLRKGRQHTVFNVSHKKGLSNLLLGDISNYTGYVNQTGINGLGVITSGPFPPNPSELLESKKNAQLLEILKENFDIIILDGAPCIGLSDSVILSSLVDKVILVTSENTTQKSALKETKKLLDNVGANIAGCVINNISAKKRGYGNYYYYGKYGYSNGDKK